MGCRFRGSPEGGSVRSDAAIDVDVTASAGELASDSDRPIQGIGGAETL